MGFLAVELGRFPSEILDGMSSADLTFLEAYYRVKRERDMQALAEQRAQAGARRRRR